MKKMFALLLVLIVTITSLPMTIAEESTLTADELAYQVYLNLEYACDNVINYMTEMEKLWGEAISLKDISAADTLWFSSYISFEQFMAMTKVASDWGMESLDVVTTHGFANAFKNSLNQYSQDTTNLIWAGLEFFTVIGYLDDISLADTYLIDAKEGIRALTALDKEYPFLTELKEYYKEATYMLEYVMDFNDNLTGLNSQRQSFEKTQHSYAVDFEFIFDPADFDAVTDQWGADFSQNKAESVAQYTNARDAMKIIVETYVAEYVAESAKRAEKAKRAESASWNKSISTARGFHDGLAIVVQNGKYGYINLEGELVVPCQYDYALDFVDGVAIVQKNGKCGIINTTGTLVSDCQWSLFPYEISEGLIKVNNGNSNGFIDANGNQVIPCTWGLCSSFSEGLAYATNKSTLQGVYIDKTGKTVLNGNWSGGSEFHEGLAAVQNDKGLWGYIDTNGEVVIPYTWNQANDFYNGVAIVKKNNQYGVINNKGEVIVPYGTYASIFNFQDEYTAVQKNGKWGFIDTTGKLIIPCQYDKAEYVYDGVAVVIMNGKYGLIDISGSLVVDCVWDNAWWSRGYLHVEKNGKCGMTDTAGNVVVPCEYESAYYGEGYFTLVKNGEVYIYDENMNQIL